GSRDPSLTGGKHGFLGGMADPQWWRLVGQHCGCDVRAGLRSADPPGALSHTCDPIWFGQQLIDLVAHSRLVVAAHCGALLQEEVAVPYLLTRNRVDQNHGESGGHAL